MAKTVMEMIVSSHVKYGLIFLLMLLTIIYLFLNFKVNSFFEVDKGLPSVFRPIDSAYYFDDNKRALLDDNDWVSKSISSSSLTIEDKIRNENARRKKSFGIIFSDAWILEKLEESGVSVSSSLKERMISGKLKPGDNEEILLMLQSVMSAEETFLNNAKNLSELKEAAKKRSIETGYFYGNKILAHPLAYKDTNVEEIVELLDDGAVLPENIIELALFQDNIELVVKLNELGYPINEQYLNTYNGMNALEVMMEGVSVAPSRNETDRILQNIDMLLGLGVPIANHDGTRDALDLVLQGALFDNGYEANNLLIIAQHLNKRGFAVQESHQQLLGRLKKKFPKIFLQENYEFY